MYGVLRRMSVTHQKDIFRRVNNTPYKIIQQNPESLSTHLKLSQHKIPHLTLHLI